MRCLPSYFHKFTISLKASWLVVYLCSQLCGNGRRLWLTMLAAILDIVGHYESNLNLDAFSSGRKHYEGIYFRWCWTELWRWKIRLYFIERLHLHSNFRVIVKSVHSLHSNFYCNGDVKMQRALLTCLAFYFVFKAAKCWFLFYALIDLRLL